MGVTAFRIENCLSFQDTKWIELKSFTFLYGENSSGKSNIHRVLQAIKSSIVGASVNIEDTQFELLDFQSLIPYNSTQNDALIALSFRFDILSQVIDGTSKLSQQLVDLKLIFTSSGSPNKGDITEFSITTSEKSENDEQVILHGRKTRDTNNWIIKSEYYKSALEENVIWPKTNIVFSFPPQLTGVNEKIDEITRIHTAQDDEGQDLFDENNELVYLDEDTSESTRFSKNSIKFISDLLKQMQIELVDIFGNYFYIPSVVPSEINPDLAQTEGKNWTEYVRSITQQRERGLEKDIGAGLSKVTYLIQKIIGLRQNSICFLEHPDAFLGLKVQGRFVDFLISIAYKHKIKFIIESHSEIILLRLRKRVKQFSKNRSVPIILGDLEKDTQTEDLSSKTSVSILKKDIFDNSKVTILHFNKFGEFLEIPFWPDNFFDDTFKEKLLLDD